MAGKAIARSFFDQYSVVCVFGSVMGCVIVPLLTQVRPGTLTVSGPGLGRVGGGSYLWIALLVLNAAARFRKRYKEADSSLQTGASTCR